MISRKRSNAIRSGSYLVDTFIYLLVAFIALITLFPFIYVVSASFSDPLEVVAGNVWLYPVGFSIKAYQRLFTSSAIWIAFRNSVMFTSIITVLNVINSMLAGYALTRRGLVFRRFFIMYLLLPMYFSGGLIPSFIIMSKLRLYNSIFAIILPSIIGIYNIILARTFVAGLPTSLKEAAIIDGAGEVLVFTKIILPLSKPIIAVLALYTALAAWNSWFNYMIYMPQKIELHPLQMFLTKVLIWGNMNSVLSLGENVDPAIIKNKILMAAIGTQIKFAVMVVATVPIILVYPFVQRFFIKGALLGSLKE